MEPEETLSPLPKLDRAVFTPDVVAALTEPDQTSINRVVRDLAPAHISSVPHRSDADASPWSVLGYLAVLPAELFLAVATYLDMRSLSRLSRLCTHARAIVEAMPVYRDLIAHMPDALAALGATGLLGVHLADDLRAVLRDPACYSCGVHFGGFLFLPTARRACLACLAENLLLRVMRPEDVAFLTGLTADELATLPQLRIQPGTYPSDGYIARRIGTTVVALTHARKLADRLQSWSRRPEKAVPVGCLLGRAPVHALVWRQLLQDAVLEQPGDPTLLPLMSQYRGDELAGVAVVRLPHLRPPPRPDYDGPSDLDHGRLCRGCLTTYSRYRYRRLPSHVAEALFPRGLADGGARAVEAAMDRLWTREGFIEHVRGCYGVRELMRFEGFGVSEGVGAESQ